MPKVSIIIPAYNAEKFIHQTIVSALNQTMKDLEVIVVDDGSADRTAEIIKSIKDSRIHYIWQKNKGVSSARNRAIRHSRGKYIALLDHDDLWMPDKLEKQLMLFEGNPNLGLVFSDIICFKDGIGDLYSGFSFGKPYRGNVFRHLLRENFIPIGTVVIRKDALLSLDECFCEAICIAEDYDFFLRLAYSYGFDYIEKPLAKYRLHSQQDSEIRSHLLVPELKFILKRLKTSISQFGIEYKKEIDIFNMKTDDREAWFLWQKGKLKDARRKYLPLCKWKKRIIIMFPFLFFNCKFFIPFKNFIFKTKYRFRKLLKKL